MKDIRIHDLKLWKEIDNEDLLLQILIEWMRTRPLNLQDCMSKAIELGYVKIVDHLIHIGANVNGPYFSLPPLINTTRLNRYQIADLLLKNGANVDTLDGWALEIACRSGHAKMVETLLKWGAQKKLDFSLGLALRENYKDIITMLLRVRYERMRG
jgi:hypothetical protein